jgi:hypothetical protein
VEDEEIVVMPSAGDVAKVEFTRQLIILGFSIVGTIATVYIAQRLQDRDTRSILKMWGALTAKRWADKQAERFTRLAAYMGTVYNGEKL